MEQNKDTRKRSIKGGKNIYPKLKKTEVRLEITKDTIWGNKRKNGETESDL